MALLGLCMILVSTPLMALVSFVIIVRAPSKIRIYLPLIVLTFAFIAYCYEPTYSNDLSRYFNSLERLKTVPFSEAFSWANDGLVVKNLLFWLIAKTHDKHILPALVIGCLYGVTFYISADSIESRYENLWKVLMIQIMLLPIYLATSNVRNMLCFALLELAVYRDAVQGKKNIITTLLYILPCFIHMTGIIVVLVRFMVILFHRHFRLGLISTAVIPTFVSVIYSRLGTFHFSGNIGKILNRIIWKSYASLATSSDYAQSMQQSGYVNACMAVVFVASVCLILLNYQYLDRVNKTGKDSRYYNLSIFSLVFCAITCIWILSGAVKYWIFEVAVVISSGPVISYYIRKWSEVRKFSRILLCSIVAMAVLRAGLELYFISGRIDLRDYGERLATSNIYTVIFNLFRTLFSN